jgi:hypothetical protein
MRGSGQGISSMAMVSTDGQMEQDMKAYIDITDATEMGVSYLQMGQKW